MLSSVVLMGRMVTSPELKSTNSGIPVTSFRIAVDRNYVKSGVERQSDFIDVVAWRNNAEFVCRNFPKGSLIAIDGQLQSRQFTTKEGLNRTSIEVVADNVCFTGERRKLSEQNSDSQIRNSYAYGGSQVTPYNADNVDGTQLISEDDDLPF